MCVSLDRTGSLLTFQLHFPMPHQTRFFFKITAQVFPEKKRSPAPSHPGLPVSPELPNECLELPFYFSQQNDEGRRPRNLDCFCYRFCGGKKGGLYKIRVVSLFFKKLWFLFCKSNERSLNDTVDG